MIEVDIKESEETDETDSQSDRAAFEAWVAEQDEKVQAMVKDGIAGLTSALQKERDAAREAAKLKKQLEEAQAKLDEFKTDEEKELDDLKASIETLTTEKAASDEAAEKATAALIKARKSFTVTANALKMGFKDPDDAEALLDPESITINDEDEVEGVEKALKELAKAKPYLLGKGDGVGTPESGDGQRQSSDDKKAPIKSTIRF